MCSKVRPHHGLCIQFFEGKGYSDTFTLHMGEVIRRLDENTVIELAAARDEICSCCPNDEEAGCRTSEKVKRYDNKVLELTQTKEGERIFWQEFVQKVKANIIDAGRMQEVCGDCGWAGICHKK